MGTGDRRSSPVETLSAPLTRHSGELEDEQFARTKSAAPQAAFQREILVEHAGVAKGMDGSRASITIGKQPIRHAGIAHHESYCDTESAPIKLGSF